MLHIVMSVCMFGAVQYAQFIYFSKGNLSPVWEKPANSAHHLLFFGLLRYVCPSFPFYIMRIGRDIDNLHI